jgi:hypothetical protein
MLAVERPFVFGCASGPDTRNLRWTRRNSRVRRGFVATDDVPGANFPFFDQAVADVGIVVDERFDDAFVASVEDEKSAIGGIGERSPEKEFAEGVGFGNAAQVFFAKGAAASDEIVDDIVEDGEVRHGSLPGSIFTQSGKRRNILS